MDKLREDIAKGTTPAAWIVDRAKEPSTWQGISILAGLASKFILGDPVIGQQALELGLAICGAIQVGKREPVAGRDY